MVYKYMKTQEDLNELIDSSAITMLGLYEGENGDLAFQDYLKDYLEDDTIYITMGKTINEFYGTSLPEDLRIVSLKYNKLGRLPIIRLEIGAKWFDDFIDNLQKNKKRGVREMTNQELKRQCFLEATKRINEKRDKALLEIAKKHSYAIEERGDLEKRNNDSEDFLEVSVWSLKEMLKEAYELGKQNN